MRSTNTSPVVSGPLRSWSGVAVLLAMVVAVMAPTQGPADVPLSPAATSTLAGWVKPVPGLSGDANWHEYRCNGQGTYPTTGRVHMAGDYGSGWNVHSGDPVYAIDAGIATYVSQQDPVNRMLEIRHTASDGTVFTAIYGHVVAASKFTQVTTKGTISIPVARGETIGTVVDQGDNTHLHFGIWAGASPHYNPYWGSRDCGANEPPVDPSRDGLFRAPATFLASHPAGGSPRGHLDSVTIDQAGYVHVKGWAFDMDQPTTSISVHVYVGGSSSSGEGHAITANASRPDLGTAYPGVGNNHGFDAEIPTSRYGTQPVYVYAINAAGTGGSNVSLGSKSLWVTPTPYVGTQWEPVGDKRFTRISLGPFGNLWAVSTRGRIFQYAGGGTWTLHGSGFRDVAVGWPNDASTGGPQVYAIKKSDGSVRRWRVDHWEDVPGHFRTLDFGPGGDLWAVDAHGRIFQYAGGGTWTKRGTGFRDVAAGMPLDVATGGPRIYGVRDDGSIERWRTDQWEGVPGTSARLDFGLSELWAVKKHGALFQYAGEGTWVNRGTGFIDVTVGMPGDGVGAPRVYALRSDGSVVRWR